jgi:undecaprenyl-diphosphatase
MTILKRSRRCGAVGLDEDLLDALGGLGSPHLDLPMVLLTVLGTAYIVVLLGPLLWLWGHRREAVDFLLLFAAVELATVVLKLLIQRPRPPDPALLPFLALPTDPALPSGHAARTFAAACLVGRLSRRLAPPALALAAAIGYSRIYLRFHFPSDVAAGAILGVGIALMVAVLQGSPHYRRWREEAVALVAALVDKLRKGPEGVQDLGQGGRSPRHVPGQDGGQGRNGDEEGVPLQVEDDDGVLLRSGGDG